jgi:hypothetical protein
MEDELFTLSDTGKAIWDRLDGQRRMQRETRAPRHPSTGSLLPGALLYTDLCVTLCVEVHYGYESGN